MAEFRTVSKKTLVRTKEGKVAESYSTTSNDSVHYVSDKTSGSWVTFPDGSKFRKPTSYANRVCGYVGESPQNDVGKYRQTSSKPYESTTSFSSNGGYRPEILLSANCPGVKGLTFNKLNDTLQFPAGMLNEANTKALNDIADQKANIGENLGTLRQLTGMIKSPSTQLVRLLTDAWKDRGLRPYLRKSLRQLGKTDISEEIASRYLEYVYGWVPLMNDIHGIMELMKDSSMRPLLLHGRGKSRQTKQTIQSNWYDASAKAKTWLGPLEESVTVRTDLWARIDPNASAIRRLNQLGLINPVSLAWDLTPWSFVVDWFVPIGPVLSALSAPAGLIFVSGTNSVRTRASGPYEHASTSWRGLGPNGSVSVTDVNATGRAYLDGYRRTTLGSWPLPKFYFNRNPFAGDRALKALALSIVNLRKLRI